jgi:hypothetical protein
MPPPLVNATCSLTSIDDAANFVPRTPRDDGDWVGRSLFSPGYQTWPRVVDGKLVY